MKEKMENLGAFFELFFEQSFGHFFTVSILFLNRKKTILNIIMVRKVPILPYSQLVKVSKQLQAIKTTTRSKLGVCM